MLYPPIVIRTATGHGLRRAVAIVFIIIVTAIALFFIWGSATAQKTASQQATIADFYLPPSPLPNVPEGTVLRSEPMSVIVPGASVVRVLYMSALADGTPAVSGGMVYIPTAPAPNADGMRPVVAWAHPTTGGGDACAPSRSTKPLNDTDDWLDQMLSFGWIVTATDYAGLGTPGPSNYIVGGSEARDVVNSVRAARNLPGADAGNEWVVWGHSQGGHAALWTGELAKTLAPELNLLAVAAAAPAANLKQIMQAQWNTVIGWVIGPDVADSWSSGHASVLESLPTALSGSGLRNYEKLSQKCVAGAGQEGLLRSTLHQTFFAADPMQVPAWVDVVAEQTPTPILDIPVFIAQGTADEVVLPGPNALLQEQWCAAGSNLSMLWMGEVGHSKAAVTAGPAVVSWIRDRFQHRDAVPSCSSPAPVIASAP